MDETEASSCAFMRETAPFQLDSDVIPHEQRPELRRGRLKNGNPSGDYMKAPRCGAKNRRGKPCQCPAVRGKRRCRLHGGKSTGAKTLAGIQRIRGAHWKDGSRSARLLAEAKVLAERKRCQMLAEITKNWKPSTIPIRRLLGLPDIPNIRVRVRVKCPEGPPEEWAEWTPEE